MGGWWQAIFDISAPEEGCVWMWQKAAKNRPKTQIQNLIKFDLLISEQI